ncbi:MAG TPA: glycosyltransferase family 4 protein [Thermoflexus sp.]|nr:glycosyltransferase family 4 protein [Thermoflexus sp.]
MRVALVVHKFPPASVGGTEVYTLNLARALAARGHEVFVFYRRDRPGDRGLIGSWEEREGFRAFWVSQPIRPSAVSMLRKFIDTFWNPGIERAFDQFLRAVHPDLVHFQHLMSLSYRLIHQAKRAGLPVVLTLHDYWFLCGNAQLIWPDGQVCRGKAWGWNCAHCALAGRVPRGLEYLLRPAAALLLQIRDRLVGRAALQADRLIAPSRFLIQQYVQAGFPAERMIYLENGIDVERIWRYSHRPASDGRVRFTYLGALAWQKGVHVVVEAFRGIPSERAVLRVFGDPALFPEYAAALRRRADPTNTRFEGPVPNEEVGRVLAETDVLLVPSLWYENSPVVIQEALAAGVPVIASDLGALVEKVQPGVNGWRCPPGDVQAWRACLLSILERSSPREGLWMESIRVLSMPEHIAQLEEIYRSLLGMPARLEGRAGDR